MKTMAQIDTELERCRIPNSAYGAEIAEHSLVRYNFLQEAKSMLDNSPGEESMRHQYNKLNAELQKVMQLTDEKFALSNDTRRKNKFRDGLGYKKLTKAIKFYEYLLEV